MSDSVIIAIFGLVGTVIGSLLGVLASAKLTTYRIEQLEKKVEKHNNLIDRTYRLESYKEVVKEEINHINHALEELEGHHNE